MAAIDVSTLPYFLGWLESDLSAEEFGAEVPSVPSHRIRTHFLIQNEDGYFDQDYVEDEMYPDCCVGLPSFFDFLVCRLDFVLCNVTKLTVFETPWQHFDQFACHVVGFYHSWEHEQFRINILLWTPCGPLVDPLWTRYGPFINVPRIVLFHRYCPLHDRDVYTSKGKLKKQGTPQFSVDSKKYRNRKKIETKVKHLKRSFSATKAGRVGRMGTMDAEWSIGELDRYACDSWILLTFSNSLIMTQNNQTVSIPNGEDRFILFVGIKGGMVPAVF